MRTVFGMGVSPGYRFRRREVEGKGIGGVDLASDLRG
jgi:hypothetical protein